jgi:DNA-binding response OmpR family regulator
LQTTGQNIEIVVIEDEPDVLELIEYILTKEGYKPVGFLSTEYVEQFLGEEAPSLMIVDRNLPKTEGSKFVAHLREIGYDIPVIFLTAKDKEQDIIDGFNSGGDDYMTKPFKPSELVARVKSLLKRSGVATQTHLSYRDIEIDTLGRLVRIASKETTLTNLEFKLLIAFITNQNQIISRDFLRDEIWGDDTNFHEKTINVALNRLKKKIDPDGIKNYFAPVWGIGYKLA